LAVHDCLSEVSWPRNKFLQEGSDLLDKLEESLEGLQKDPDAPAKESNGPTVTMNRVVWRNQEWQREIQRILQMIQYSRSSDHCHASCNLRNEPQEQNPDDTEENVLAHF